MTTSLGASLCTIALVVTVSVGVVCAQAQSGSSGASQPPVIPPVVETVTVVETTPLPGTTIPVDRLPAPVQLSFARDIRNTGAIDLSSFMNERLNAVHVNELQGNPFQADVNYRGYTASPLLGTPQGLSVYMDGVRLNQPFGDVMSWDLIPKTAILSMALMPGSNPMFGLNTLGGALSIQSKSGLTSPGTTIQSIVGRSMRRALEFEHGGSKTGGLHWYLTGNLFGEDGWREVSPSDVRQLFGKIGWQRPKTDVSLTIAGVDDSLNGNGLQEAGLLDRDYASVYTKPDITDNRATLTNLTVERRINPTVRAFGNVYYRRLRTNTFNGDMNEDSLDQSVYQPGAAERAALAAAGYSGFPTSGATAENTPFPSWRCVANVLLADEPAEQCNGIINRTKTRQLNAGMSGQVTWLDSPDGSKNQLTIGAAYDHSNVAFGQSAELGYLAPDRRVVGLGVFADGLNAGSVVGEPFDTRVDLDGRTHTASVYGTNTATIGGAWHLTLSGRYNRTTIANTDRIRPAGDLESLDGRHVFSRFNPAVGVTFNPSGRINAYAGFSESSRTATSIELGCANPGAPCKLPNAMAGDPPLDQVVTRTVEAGVRGNPGRGISWNAGWFRSQNRDDILFVASEQTGFGYFRNFGATRRQGVEVGVMRRARTVMIGAAYTFLDATYQSEEIVDGTGNSSNEAAGSGIPGVEGTIAIEPGNRIPLVPRHVAKLFAEIQLSRSWFVDVNLVGISGSLARGNENNQHEPDGVYYTGVGATDGYAIVNLGATYRISPRWQALVQINNLLNTKYETAAQLGANGLTRAGTFVARPFPAVGGVFPVQHATFVAPGAPVTAWGGVRVTF